MSYRPESLRLPERQCLACGKRFRPWRQGSHKQRRARERGTTLGQFCSRQCVAFHKRRLQPPEPGPHSHIAISACRQCGRLFVTRNKRIPNRYCCRRCNDTWHNAHRPSTSIEVKQCAHLPCSVSFAPRMRTQRYCSSRCSAAARRRNDKARHRARLAGTTRIPYRPVDIYERDGWRCRLCGKKINRRHRAPHSLAPSIDHIIPIALGGPDAPNNVQAAHFGCNSRKRTTACGSQLRLI